MLSLWRRPFHSMAQIPQSIDGDRSKPSRIARNLAEPPGRVTGFFVTDICEQALGLLVTGALAVGAQGALLEALRALLQPAALSRLDLALVVGRCLAQPASRLLACLGRRLLDAHDCLLEARGTAAATRLNGGVANVVPAPGFL